MDIAQICQVYFSPTGGVEKVTSVLAEELGRAISRFLRVQKESARVVFLRRYWYAVSVEQAAAHMGWSISKTKTVLYRTRNRLRDFLEQEGLWNG